MLPSGNLLATVLSHVCYTVKMLALYNGYEWKHSPYFAVKIALYLLGSYGLANT